jgi:hypothetical protein
MARALEPPAEGGEPRVVPVQRLVHQRPAQRAAALVGRGLGENVLEEGDAALLLGVDQPPRVDAHEPADVLPQVHHVLAFALGDGYPHQALAEEEHDAESQVGDGHVRLVDGQAERLAVPFGFALHVVPHHGVHQADLNRRAEAGALASEAPGGRDVDPPLQSLGGASLRAVSQRAGEHERPVDGRGLVAAHEGEVSQDEQARLAGEAAQACTGLEARLVDPRGACVDVREEGTQRGRHARGAVDAVDERVLEERTGGVHAGLLHPCKERVGGRVALEQPLPQGLPLSGGRLGIAVNEAAEGPSDAAGLLQVGAVAARDGVRRRR